MAWDVARIWTSLDKTFDEIKWIFKRSSYPAGRPEMAVERLVSPERIDPGLEMDGSPISNKLLIKHLVWMFEETKKLAADGRVDKAQRWLGFIQGAAWAKGLTTLSRLKEANRDTTDPQGYLVDDLVTYIGETGTLFRVAKVSYGGEPDTGSAFLLRKNENEWIDHGWEDFITIRLVSRLTVTT